MNYKYISDLRFTLGNSGIVKEGDLCRKFGVSSLEDLPDPEYGAAKDFIYSLLSKVRAARRAAKKKPRVGQYSENSDYFKFDYRKSGFVNENNKRT